MLLNRDYLVSTLVTDQIIITLSPKAIRIKGVVTPIEFIEDNPSTGLNNFRLE